MFPNSISSIVKSVTDSYDFNKVSDLTKEQFTEILTNSIYECITSSDYTKFVSEQLVEQIRNDEIGKGKIY